MADKNSTNDEHTTDHGVDDPGSAGDVTGGADAPATVEGQSGEPPAPVRLDRRDIAGQGGDEASLHAPPPPISLETLVLAAEKAEAAMARELEADRAEEDIELTLDANEPTDEVLDGIEAGAEPKAAGGFTEEDLRELMAEDDLIAEKLRGAETLGDKDATSSSVAEVLGTSKSDSPTDAPTDVPSGGDPVQPLAIVPREREDPIAPGERDKGNGLLVGPLDRRGAERPHRSKPVQSAPLCVDVKKVRAKRRGGSSGSGAAPGEGDSGQPPGVEITDALSVRPEMIIIPQLTSLTVSRPSWSADSGRGTRNLMYIQYADGRRECRVQDTLMLLDDIVLLHSSPPSEEHDLRGETWQPESCQAWLKGAVAPNVGRLFTDIVEQMDRYIYVPESRREEELSLLGLWVMLSYSYRAWPAIPYLYLNGPPGSGKSRILDVLKRQVFRPISSSNATAAAVFHWLDIRGGTLLLDEAERLGGASQDTEQLMSILLSGYQQEMPALRVARRFDVFGPKALACIGNIHKPLLSRCICIDTVKAPEDADQIQRQVSEDVATWMCLRNDLHASALSNGVAFLDLASQRVGQWLTGRQRDVWQPMLSLAGWVEGHGVPGLQSTIERMARRLIETENAGRSLSADEVLLRALAEFSRQGVTVTTKQILEVAQKQAPVLLSTYSARKASSCLDKYGLKTSPSNGKNVRRPTPIGVFLKIQQQYGLDLGLEPPTPPVAADNVDEDPGDGSEHVA